MKLLNTTLLGILFLSSCSDRSIDDQGKVTRRYVDKYVRLNYILVDQDDSYEVAEVTDGDIGVIYYSSKKLKKIFLNK